MIPGNIQDAPLSFKIILLGDSSYFPIIQVLAKLHLFVSISIISFLKRLNQLAVLTLL